MRHILIFGLSIFLLAPQLTSANTSALSTDPSHGASFSFYCDPYISSFESGNHYKPRNSFCVYSIPDSLSSQVQVGTYKGVPGNATLIGGDLYRGDATLISQHPNIFATPPHETNLFAVVYDRALNQDNAFHIYLTEGGDLPEGAIENSTYYMLQWKWGPKPKEEFDPVIIIPGILGSWEKNGLWVMDPILHTYDNLLDTFRANGFEDNKTLFTFPYDWRKSNVTTASLLAKKIESVKKTCNCTRVDLVGHSMGGLVAAQYMESSEYKNDVDQLFFIATPLSGAPAAYETWEGGVINFGSRFENLVMQRVFKNEAKAHNYKTVFEYIRNKPISSIQELLPVYNYLNKDGAVLHYPSGYPHNPFLEQLIANIGEKVFSAARVYTVLADDLHTNTVSGYTIASSTTPGLWEHGEPQTTLRNSGDSTVPRTSIENIIEADKILEPVSHIEAASSSAPYIFSEMNGRALTTIVGKIYSPLRNADFKVLFVKLFSPIDMQIVAPDGKRLGKDFSTNTELQEIPDAFYSGFTTEDEYAVIFNPLPGTYTIQTIGTGSGPYTILADVMDINGLHEAELSGTTTQGQIFSAALSISATSSVSLQPKDTPPQEPVTPERCRILITKAYTLGWITKKSTYAALLADCTVLQSLLLSKERLVERLGVRAQKVALNGIHASMAKILDHMDLLARDKSNTKDAVQLITQITTWYREKQLHI